VIHRRLPYGTFTALAYPDSMNRALARAADGGLWLSGMTSAFLFQEPGWLPAVLPTCGGIFTQLEPIGRTALMTCTDFGSMTQRVFEVAPATGPRDVFATDGGLPLLRARSAEAAFLVYLGNQQFTLQLQLDGGTTPLTVPETSGAVFFSSNGEHLLMRGATAAWRFASGSWTAATAIPAGREFDGFDFAMPSGLLSGPSELFFFGAAATWPTITNQVPPSDRTYAQLVTPFQGPGLLPRFLIGEGVYDLAADGGLSALTSLGSGLRIAGTRDGGFIALNASGLLSRWNNSASTLATSPVGIFQLNAVAVANDDSAVIASLNQLYRLPPGSMSPQAFDAGAGVRGFISATPTPAGSVLVATQTQVFDLGPSSLTSIPAPAGGYLGTIESACATGDTIFVKTFTELWLRQAGQWRRAAPGVVARLACSPSRAAIVGTAWLEFLGDGGTRPLQSLQLAGSEMQPFYGADGRLWIGAPAGELVFHP
jgi:hypothetical protein